MKLHWKEHKRFCLATKEEQEAHDALEKEKEEGSAIIESKFPVAPPAMMFD